MGVWQYVETVWLSQLGGGGDAAAGLQWAEARDAAEHLPCTGQPPQHGVVWPKVSGGARLGILGVNKNYLCKIILRATLHTFRALFWVCNRLFNSESNVGVCSIAEETEAHRAVTELGFESRCLGPKLYPWPLFYPAS